MSCGSTSQKGKKNALSNWKQNSVSFHMNGIMFVGLAQSKILFVYSKIYLRETSQENDLKIIHNTTTCFSSACFLILDHSYDYKMNISNIINNYTVEISLVENQIFLITSSKLLWVHYSPNNFAFDFSIISIYSHAFVHKYD